MTLLHCFADKPFETAQFLREEKKQIIQILPRFRVDLLKLLGGILGNFHLEIFKRSFNEKNSDVLML